MFEGDAQGILDLFLKDDDNRSHPLLRGARLVGNNFSHIRVQHTWKKENMYTDFTAGEGTNLESKMIC